MATLDVLITTFNRADSLERLLSSIHVAVRPTLLQLTITVIDNGSTDRTRLVARDAGVSHLYEAQQGQCFARNAGIAHTTGEWVAFLDDDEAVLPGWFCAAEQAMNQHPAAQFFGGPYKAVWEVPPPDWITSPLRLLLGDYDFGPRPCRYDEGFPGLLPGGNCLVRRTLFQKVGPYEVRIGHAGGKRLGNDDTEMYQRLLQSGAEGWYIPELAVKHFIPKGRLTRGFVRSQKWAGGVAMGMLDRWQHPAVPRVAGLPRYLVGDFVRGLFRRTPFESELQMRYIAGFLCGQRYYS